MDLNVIADDNNPFSLAAGDVLRGAMMQYKLPLFSQVRENAIMLIWNLYMVS